MEPIGAYHFSNSRESREAGHEKPKRAGLKDQRYISEERERAREHGVGR
jgi:hypothetical protein